MRPTYHHSMMMLLLLLTVLLQFRSTTTKATTAPITTTFATPNNRMLSPFPNHHHHSSLHPYYSRRQRHLEEGDFDSINKLLEGATIAIPGFVYNDTYLLQELVLNLTNILCSNLYISDVQVNTVVEEQGIDKTFSLEAVKIDTDCLIDYTYDYGVFSGSGVVQAFTEDTGLSVDITVGYNSTEEAEDIVMPTIVKTSNCVSGVEITDLRFTEGGVIAGALNVVEGALRDFVEGEINDFFCGEIFKLNTAGSKFLQNISDYFEPYLKEDEDEEDTTSLVLNETALSDDMKLIDFENPSNSGLAKTVDDLLEYAFEILAANSSTGDGGETLGINKVLETFLLDDNGVFSLRGATDEVNENGIQLFNTSITEESFLYIEVTLRDVKIGGLNTFSRVDPLITVGPHVLQSGFGLNELETELEIEIYLESISSEIEPGQKLAEITEQATIGIGLSDLSLSNTSMLVAIQEEKLEILPLGAFLDSTSHVFSCFASTLYDFDLDMGDFSISKLEDPIVDDLLSPGMERIIQTAVGELYPMYKDAVMEALPNFIETTGTDIIVDAVQEIITQEKKKTDGGVCDAGFVRNEFSEIFIDFRDFFLSEEEAIELGSDPSICCNYGNIGQQVRTLLEEELLELDPTTGLPKINEALIDPLTTEQSNISGTWNLDGNIIENDDDGDNSLLTLGGDFELDESLVGTFSFQIINASLRNLNTVHMSPLKVLEPTSHPNILENEFRMGFTDRPLTLATRLLLDVKADVNGETNSIDIYNVVDLELELIELEIILDLLLRMLTERIFEFPLRDVNEIHCWLSTIPSPQLDERGVRIDDDESDPTTAGIEALDVLVQDLNLKVTCVDCSSPELQDVTEALQDPSSREDAVRSANNVLKFATSIIEGDYIQLQLDRLLKEAPTKCPHRPEYIANEDERKEVNSYEPIELLGEAEEQANEAVAFLLTLCITTVAIILVFFAIRTIVGILVRRRHGKYLRSLPEEKVYRIYRQQLWLKEREERLRTSTQSMLFSEQDIPKWIRYGIPIILLGNIGFFLSGHLSVGGSVVVMFQFAGQELFIPNFFTFSVAQSTLDLWEAGGKELAILILLFSGVWPYTKMILTLYAWIVPPTRLGVSKRGRLILLLDELAKWSTIDIFVLVLSLIAFRVSVTSPQNLSFLPKDFYSLDLLVLPKWGLYANLIAQLLSQFTSHVIIHYHRKIVSNALELENDNKNNNHSDDDDDDDDQQHEQRNVMTLSSSGNDNVEQVEETTMEEASVERPRRSNVFVGHTEGEEVEVVQQSNAKEAASLSAAADNDDDAKNSRGQGEIYGSPIALEKFSTDKVDKDDNAQVYGTPIALENYNTNKVDNDKAQQQQQAYGAPIALESLNTGKKDNNADTDSAGRSSALSTEADMDESKCLLKDHGFSRPHRGENDSLVVMSWVHYVVYATAVVLLPVFVVVGCILSSFKLEYLGLLGIFIESGQEFEEAEFEYSVFDIAKAMMDQASFLGDAKDYIGIGSIVFVFLLTVLIVPILQTIALLLHWIRPMTRQQRKRWIVIVEILQAWQYMEVFVIAVILSAWQFASVSEFFLNQYCEALDGTLATLAFYGILSEVDAQCFQVIATIKSGTYMLILGAFLLNLFNTFIMKAVLHYEREEEQRHQLFLMEKLEGNGVIISTERLMQKEDGGVSVEEAIAQIEPTPALFTDSFRWVLIREPPSSQKVSVYTSSPAKEDVEKSMSSYHITRPPKPANMGDEITRDADNMIDVEEPSGPMSVVLAKGKAVTKASMMGQPSSEPSISVDGYSGIYNYSEDEQSESGLL